MERGYQTQKFIARFCCLLGLWFIAPLSLFADDPAPGFRLDSTEPYQAVHVPFTIRNGEILMQMELSGKNVVCLLDTGMFATVWHKDLLLSGNKTGHIETVTDAAGNTSYIQEVVLPSLRLGNYEVRNLSTYEMGATITPKSMLEQAVRQNPLINNEAFRDVVLTIDYSKKELVIRSPSYDFTKEPEAKNGKVLSFTRLTHDKKRFYGKPAVRGKINGVSARIQVDTDWRDKIWLDERLVKKLNKQNALPFDVYVLRSVDNITQVATFIRHGRHSVK